VSFGPGSRRKSARSRIVASSPSGNDPSRNRKEFVVSLRLALSRLKAGLRPRPSTPGPAGGYAACFSTMTAILHSARPDGKDRCAKTGSGGTGQTAGDPSGLSASLAEYLTAQKTAAIRAELAQSPSVALAAVVHALALKVKQPDRPERPTGCAFQVRPVRRPRIFFCAPRQSLPPPPPCSGAAPCAASACSSRARLCSSVETRAQPIFMPLLHGQYLLFSLTYVPV
jgi:hypothetical protein